MSGYSEEQRTFINNLKLEGKTIAEIQVDFREKWNRTPAPVTINKYGRYHLWAKDRQETPDIDSKETPKDQPKEEIKDEKGGVLEVEVKDLRKKKEEKTEVVHFSDGNMEQKDFDKIVKLRGTDEEETFSFLQKCGQKGFNKIDLASGEISE